MRRNSVIKSYLFISIFLVNIIVARPVKAFIPWPVIDLVEIVSFVKMVSTSLDKIIGLKTQIDNQINTVKSVGDSINTARKYFADLKSGIAAIVDTVEFIKDTVEDVLEDSIDILEDVSEEINEELGINETTSEELVGDINSGTIENFDEASEYISAAEEDFTKTQESINEQLDVAIDSMNESLNSAIETVDNMVSGLEDTENVSDEDKEDIKSQAEVIISEIEELQENISTVIEDLKTSFNEVYDENVLSALEAYEIAIESYYNGDITNEDLSSAGDVFVESVSSAEVNVSDSLVELQASVDSITSKIDDLGESIVNLVSNDKDYSMSTDTYKFNSTFIEENRLATVVYDQNGSLTGVYSDNDSAFLLPRVFACDEFSSDNDISSLEEDVSILRTCIVRAKTEKESDDDDPYADSLYTEYQRNGVYKQAHQNYSTANIVNLTKIKQYTATWGDLDNDDSTINALQESVDDVDNTRNANSLLATINIEAPRFWSALRRVDGLQRATNTVVDLSEGTTLYLDGRDEEFTNATNDQPGLYKNTELDTETQIFPNVLLYKCDLKADDISLDEGSKNNTDAIKEAETNLYNCLFKYAKAASLGLEESVDSSAEGYNPESVKNEWRIKQRKVIHDAVFSNLALSVINTYKSSLDYLPVEDLDTGEMNIVTIQEDLQSATTSRDDYAAAAQINYYTTLQILSIVDSEALNMQADAMREIPNYTYNYYGEVAGEDE